MFSIVLYTHTDVKDVWSPFFGQTEKYLKDYNKYILVNKDDESIPSNYTKVYYNDSSRYIDRLIETLEQINEDYVLYQHEDMFLYDKPDTKLLNDFTSKITDDKPFIRLMRGGNGVGPSDVDFKDLKLMDTSFQYIFAIQPTIWRRDKLIELLKNTEGRDIWDFEVKAQKTCRDRNMIGYYIDDGSPKRGKSHWDSKIYPYIATAISKGKWNVKEYSSELNAIANEYSINLSERGTNG